MKDWFSSDRVFNGLYPKNIQEVAEKHWTPVSVAEKASAFLTASPTAKVLDVGSGCGKFCLVAAHHHALSTIYGIEQRPALVMLASQVAEKLHLGNVQFICDNITNIDFEKFDSFYFYNAFYENVTGTQKIDFSVNYSEDLYHHYNRYLYRQLDKKPAGTRLVTYHSFGAEIPSGYEIVHTEYNEFLKFWIKV